MGNNHLNHISLKQECIPVGCVPSAAVAVCWGVSAPRGCLLWWWGWSAPGGVVSQHALRQTPPVDRQTCCIEHNLRNFVPDGNNKTIKSYDILGLRLANAPTSLGSVVLLSPPVPVVLLRADTQTHEHTDIQISRSATVQKCLQENNRNSTTCSYF